MVFCEPVPRSMVTSRPAALNAPLTLAVMNGACGPCGNQSSANFTLVCAWAGAVVSASVASERATSDRSEGKDQIMVEAPSGRSQGLGRAEVTKLGAAQRAEKCREQPASALDVRELRDLAGRVRAPPGDVD